MRQWIGRKLSACALKLTGLGMDVRGIPQVEPEPLSAREQAVSDATLSNLSEVERFNGRMLANATAIGTMDGCSRYLHGEVKSQPAAAE